jgi:hypothetical protein
MPVYIINFIKLCHSYVRLFKCCSDSMNNYVWGCWCFEVFFLNDAVLV